MNMLVAISGAKGNLSARSHLVRAAGGSPGERHLGLLGFANPLFHP